MMRRTKPLLLLWFAVSLGSSWLRAQGEAPAVVNGNAAFQKGDFDQAIAFFSDAIEADPKNVAAYDGRGRAYQYKGGEDEKAMADFQQAILLGPHDAHGYGGRAISYSRLGDDDKALADFNRAIELDPKYQDAYFLRGSIYQDRADFDRAIADFDQAVQLNPKDSSALYSRGMCLCEKGEYDKAIADFDQTIQLAQAGEYGVNAKGDMTFQLNPQVVDALNNRGLAYRAKGDYAKALADYGQAIQLDANDVDGYRDRALLLATCPQADFRDGSKAVADATKACELSGWKVPYTVNVLAAAEAEAGNFADAVKWESTFLETPNLSPKSIALARRHLALYRAGKPYHADQ